MRSHRMSPNKEGLDTIEVHVPKQLHPDTIILVHKFACAMMEKLKKAQDKYGYTNGWAAENVEWKTDCYLELRKHMEKGDPMDVAIYAAFMWHHGWTTNGQKRPPCDDCSSATFECTGKCAGKHYQIP